MLTSSRANTVAFAERERRRRERRFSGTNVSVCVKSHRKQSVLTRASPQMSTGAEAAKQASNSAFVTLRKIRIRSLPLVLCLCWFSYTGILEMMESRTAHASSRSSQQMGEVIYISSRAQMYIQSAKRFPLKCRGGESIQYLS